jgi:hypothetical protein
LLIVNSLAELAVDHFEHVARDHLADLFALVFEQEMGFAGIVVAGLEPTSAPTTRTK